MSASDANAIARAAEILRQGGLVAFPTETVYGLGADARNADAVAKIFTAKARPATNPLICHVADVAGAKVVVRDWPAAAQKLAEHFWPGPLTLVLPKSPAIPPIVTAGLDSVGVRVPNHLLAIALLKAFGGPIAAPSANRANHVSPTTADHVRQDLGDRIDTILDGGPCAVGIESTVLSLVDAPTILRPGGVSREQIEAIIGPAALTGGLIEQSVPAPSPGLAPVHYAPTTPTYRYESNESELAKNALKFNQPAVCIDWRPPGHLVTVSPCRLVTLPPSPAAYAAALYAALRDADAQGAKLILIHMPPDAPPWAAVRDRLSRAARPMSQLQA